MTFDDSRRAVLALVVSLVACSGGNGEEGTTDSAASDTSPTESAPSDTGLPPPSDTAPCDAVVYDTLPDGGEVYPTLTCGSAPSASFFVDVESSDSSPSSITLTSSLCGGATLDVPSACGRSWSAAHVADLAQYLTAVASDDSLYPTLTAEFVPDVSFDGWLVTLEAKGRSRPASAFPPGFDSTKSLVELHASASPVAPCDSTAGLTVSLDAASASSHGDAQIWYFDGSSFATTPPSAAIVAVLLVATPAASGPDLVRFAGAKSGCTVDVGTRLVGSTGRLPLAAGSITEGDVVVHP